MEQLPIPVPPKHERTIVFAGALAGIVMLFLYLRSRGGTSAGYTSDSSSLFPVGTGFSGGTDVGNGDIPKVPDTVSVVPPTVHLKYNGAWGTFSNLIGGVSDSSGKNGSMGLALTLPFIAGNLGGNKSSWQSRTKEFDVKLESPDSFNVDVVVESADLPTINALVNHLQTMGGTSQEHLEHQSSMLAHQGDTIADSRKGVLA